MPLVPKLALPEQRRRVLPEQRKNVPSRVTQARDWLSSRANSRLDAEKRSMPTTMYSSASTTIGEFERDLAHVCDVGDTHASDAILIIRPSRCPWVVVMGTIRNGGAAIF